MEIRKEIQEKLNSIASKAHNTFDVSVFNGVLAELTEIDLMDAEDYTKDEFRVLTMLISTIRAEKLNLLNSFESKLQEIETRFYDTMDKQELDNLDKFAGVWLYQHEYRRSYDIVKSRMDSYASRL